MLTAAEVAGGAPADADPSTLTGAIISCDGPTGLSIIGQPVGVTVFAGRSAKFSVRVDPKPGDPVQVATLVVPDLTYQWLKNGVAVPLVDADADGIADDGSNTATYTIKRDRKTYSLYSLLKLMRLSLLNV